MEKTDTLYDRLKFKAKCTAKGFGAGLALGLDFGGAAIGGLEEENDPSVFHYVASKLNITKKEEKEGANYGFGGLAVGVCLGFGTNIVAYCAPWIILGGAGIANHYIKNKQKGDNNLEKKVAC